MKRQLWIGFYILLFCIGMEYELSSYSYGELTNKVFGLFLLCAFMLLIYLIPLGYLLQKLKKQFNLPQYFLPIAFFSGMFVAGFLSSTGNGLVEDAWRLIITNTSVMDEWADALTAPFVEETTKALAALATLYFFRRSDLGAALTAGIASGLGFQLIEDLGYIFQSLTTDITYTPADTFQRISGALTSHWLYTAIVTTGLVFFLRYYKENKKQAWLGLGFALATIALHFLWNSPLVVFDASWPVPISLPVLSTLTIFLAIKGYQILKKHL